MTTPHQNPAPTHGHAGSAGGRASSPSLPAPQYTSHAAEIAAVLARIETEANARKLADLRRRAQFEKESI